MAAAELGVMAGADRVEGTLFGNGERTEVQAPGGSIRWDVGVDESILAASLKAVISAVNRLRAASGA